ncbi:MAG TPA: M56 family metallopeptidase, partial [Gemmatales bacterium]|nr:M56 family metallopeptidase [Gemmatales bacterium]
MPPSFCHAGDPEKLRWILAHELTHLRRRDAWSCLLLALGGAVYFHLPWFWWMKRHVRLAQEYLADAAAVQLSSAVEYAQYLVSLTTLANRPTLASSRAAGVFESPSDLYRRVDMLLHQRCELEHRAPRWWTLTVAASFFTLAACTSGIQLYAEDDRPAKTVQVVVRATDDKENSSDQAVTLKATGVVALEDNDQKKKPEEKKGNTSPFQADQQQKVADALKKLDAALERLPQQLDPETRKQLEELKQSLKELKENSHIRFMRTPENIQEWSIRMKDEAQKASEAARKAAEEYRAKVEVKAKELAESVRAQAEKAEEEARKSGEKVQKFLKHTRDGASRETIEELEAAIAEKEKALEELKKNFHSKEVVPLLLEKFRGSGADIPPQRRLGIVVAELDYSLRSHLSIPQDQGLIVTKVVASGPAWNEGHGLQVSDILLTLAGKKVPNNQETFREMVRDLPAGEVKAVVL